MCKSEPGYANTTIHVCSSSLNTEQLQRLCGSSVHCMEHCVPVGSCSCTAVGQKCR